MLLTEADLLRMENDISDTIRDWHQSVTMSIPRPLDKQTNWNSKLHEFTGPIIYDDYVGVPIERVDGYTDKQEVSQAGNRNNGSIVLYMPIRYTDINKVVITLDLSKYDDIRIALDGDTWRIKSVKRLIGEYLVNISRMVGE